MTSLFNKNIFKDKKALSSFVSRFVLILTSIVLIVLSLFTSYLIVYKNKIYPNISVANINISGNSLENAILAVSNKALPPKEIILKYQDQTFTIQTKEIDLTVDYSDSVIRAYEYTRSGNIFYDFGNRIELLFVPKKFGLDIKFNEDKLSKAFSIVSGQISVDNVDPVITNNGKQISVNKGSLGIEVDQEKLKEIVVESLSFNKIGEIEIQTKTTGVSLSDYEAKDYEARANKILGKSITLKLEFKSITLEDDDLFKLIDPKGGYHDQNFSDLLSSVSLKFERNPQNPKFVFENGKVIEFQPALAGIKVDQGALKDLIIKDINELFENDDLENIIVVPVVKTLPEISTDEVNNFGIKELIGRGTSTYFHSIPGRIHNVSLATSRINGTLIKPGETFSFNETLGDVSAFTGYQQAYIINEGKTILGDGGGVCQVSSTLFRAVLNAGLPIAERQAHAYRVGYYEQGSAPGFDATVFSPSPDFRFTNDTADYILIEAINDTKNYSLVFELYGTSDGRVASTSKPVVTNVSAPPPDRYQDDPTLPIGVVRQIDYKAWGAKVTYNYSVTRGGMEIYKKTFISNYKPWAAVYLRGTGPTN